MTHKKTWWTKQPTETIAHIVHIREMLAWRLGCPPSYIDFGIETPMGFEYNPLKYGFVLSVWREVKMSPEEIATYLTNEIKIQYILHEEHGKLRL